jgi:insulin receptor
MGNFSTSISEMFLRNTKHTITYKTGVRFMVEAVSGMEYLSGKHVIHRDLAARNCLLDGNLTLKISDFGLARHVDNTYNNYDVYEPSNQRQMPFRWMPPEAIRNSDFTTMSVEVLT